LKELDPTIVAFLRKKRREAEKSAAETSQPQPEPMSVDEQDQPVNTKAEHVGQVGQIFHSRTIDINENRFLKV
jgi:hypothetical protein